MTVQDSKPQFAVQNSHGHAKAFRQKLSALWAIALKRLASPGIGYKIY